MTTTKQLCISSDSHVVEPPELFEPLVKRFGEEAPHMVFREDIGPQLYLGNGQYGLIITGFLQAGFDFGRPDAGEAALAMLAGGHRLASALFGLPFGRLEPGAPADLVVFDYRPPTPLASGNLAGHLLFGLDRSHVRSVLVAGRWVVRERRLVNLDADRVFARARLAAEAVWGRMARA